MNSESEAHVNCMHKPPTNVSMCVCVCRVCVTVLVNWITQHLSIHRKNAIKNPCCSSAAFNAAPKSRQQKKVARSEPTSVLRSRAPAILLRCAGKQIILLTIDDTVCCYSHPHTHRHTHAHTLLVLVLLSWAPCLPVKLLIRSLSVIWFVA